jgi:hypothetical protein
LFLGFPRAPRWFCIFFAISLFWRFSCLGVFCAALRVRVRVFGGPKPENVKNRKNQKTAQIPNARRATPAHAVPSAAGRVSARKNDFFAGSVKTAPRACVVSCVCVCVARVVVSLLRVFLAPGTLETT